MSLRHTVAGASGSLAEWMWGASSNEAPGRLVHFLEAAVSNGVTRCDILAQSRDRAREEPVSCGDDAMPLDDSAHDLMHEHESFELRSGEVRVTGSDFCNRGRLLHLSSEGDDADTTDPTLKVLDDLLY